MAQPVPADYSFGDRTAAAVYEELSIGRNGMMEKARQLARISIPTSFPPQGWRPEQTLPPPNQSINSQNIANLSSNIMFIALPPGRPMLKYNIIEHKVQAEIDQDPELYAKTVLALALREKANRTRMESTSIRSAYVEAVEQLLVAGNVLWRHIMIDTPSIHKMDTYVVKRNAYGQQLYVVLKEMINLGDMDLSTRGFVENVRLENATRPAEQRANEFIEEVEVYSCCKLHHVTNTKKVWLYWEEFQGEMIPDTDVAVEFDAPPLYAAWMKPNYGFNWGTSYCELYEGDMYIVENSQGGINDAAEAAAMVLLFVKPGSTTSKKSLEKSRNLRWLYGNAEDLTAFRLEKGDDLTIVQNNLAAAEQRLGRAFMRTSSIQRNAERVTAEEWRMMSKELDEAMGGLYSIMAYGLGRHIIMRYLALQQAEDKDLAPLPPGIVQIGVVTGLDAMGISDDEADLENALEVLNKFFGPQGVTALMQATNVVERVLAGNNVNPAGLIKPQPQQQAEQQQGQAAATNLAMVKGASGPVAKEAAGVIASQFANAQQQQQQPQP